MKAGVYFARDKRGPKVDEDGKALWPYLVHVEGEAPFMKCREILHADNLFDATRSSTFTRGMTASGLEFGPLLEAPK